MLHVKCRLGELMGCSLRGVPLDDGINLHNEQDQSGRLEQASRKSKMPCNQRLWQFLIFPLLHQIKDPNNCTGHVNTINIQQHHSWLWRHAGKLNRGVDLLDLKPNNNLLNLFCKLDWASINSFLNDTINESNSVISSKLITGQKIHLHESEIKN